MIKKLVLVAILLFSFDHVSALELCSPSKDYLDYMALPEEERANYQEPIYCSSVLDTNLTASNPFIGRMNEVALKQAPSTSSSFYNAYDDNLVNTSGNQYHTGLCWDFSALSVVESNAMKNNAGSYRFSTAHLAYSILSGVYNDDIGKKGKYDYDSRDGGKLTFAPTYFFNNYGQFLEKDMPFISNLNSEGILKSINSSNYNYGTSYVTVESFLLDNLTTNAKCSVSDIDTIKKDILKYGSVQATMYMDEDLFTDQTYNYYISSTNNAIGPNHAITIVGWDDSISKNLFSNATRDGAWIIKNSWGSTWSNDGLFYISYDDEFVCKGVATYGGVSTKKFDNAYIASDLVGNLVLQFKNQFYIATKFTKQTTQIETLDRVSFPVSEDLGYSVYLSKSNNLNDRSDWILLTTSISNNYGIDSINLENIEIDDDFTIIIKYDSVLVNYPTSILTMCNNNTEYKDVDISLNTNYYMEDGTNWHDLGNVDTNIGVIGCEPNIYAYTNNKNTTPKLEINSIRNIDDNISLTITKKNINDSDVTYKVLDSNGKDVTSHFTISPFYDYSIVNIVSDNTVSGTFTVVMENSDTSVSNTFKLVEDIKSINNNLVIDSDKIFVSINKGKTLTYKDVYDSLKLKNTSITITDSKGNIVNSNTSSIGTNSTIKTNDNTFKVVVKGDASGDGMIDSADLLKIVKYLKNSTSFTLEQTLASDVTKDTNIDSADLLRIVKFLKGIVSIEL